MKKLILLSTLLLISCGTRNVHKTEVKTEEQTNIVDTSKTIVNSETQIKVVDSSTNDILEIVSKDTTKPLVIDGHKYQNAIIRHSKQKNNIITQSNNKTAITEQKHVTTTIKRASVEMVKDTHREGVSLWWFLIPIIIALIIIFLFWRYRKQIVEEVSKDLPI